jgi:hypothetical protein
MKLLYATFASLVLKASFNGEISANGVSNISSSALMPFPA